LLFMGQEWGAPEPFLFFTDHNEELGRLVTEGRRKEFLHFSAFADTANHETIPDPQKIETFQRSKLNWSVRHEPEHAKCLHWYQTLLHIRKQLLEKASFQAARALNEQIIETCWQSSSGSYRAVVALEGPTATSESSFRGMRMVLSSEEDRFMCDPRFVGWSSETGTLSFERAGVVILANHDAASIVEERTQ
jgi:maltooligosyltrehalose trehalohydrolase